MPSFVSRVRLVKSGDVLTVILRQPYKPLDYQGAPTRYRTRIAGQFSLKELKKEEKNQT